MDLIVLNQYNISIALLVLKTTTTVDYVGLTVIFKYNSSFSEAQ